MLSQKGNIAILVTFVFLFLISTAGIIFLLNQGGKSQEVEKQATVQLSAPALVVSTSTLPDYEQDWQIYKNDKYGFEIQLPPNSKAEPGDENYIRIQNYTEEDISKNNYRLANGQYYLEAFINSGKCEESFDSYQEVEINEVKVYKGQGIGAGDASAIRTSLCWEKSETTYFIRVSEEEPAVAEKIINSFKFIN